jgi:hypothetical protein
MQDTEADGTLKLAFPFVLLLMSTTEELLGRKSSGSGLASREYGRRDPSS